MKDLWNSRDEQSWINAESTLYDKHVKPENRELERRLETGGLRARLAGMTPEKFFDFLHDEYFVWKFTDQYLKKHLSSLEGHLKGSGLLRLDKVREIIYKNELSIDITLDIIKCKVMGLGIVGASGLLALVYPEEYGTVDRMIVRSFHASGLFLDIEEKDISSEQAEEMIIAMRKKARELNQIFHVNKWTPRTIDRALWGHRGEDG